MNDPNVKRLGTRGQRQNGVDLVGYRDRDPNQIVGIQCKLKSGRSRLSAREIHDEVKKALGYKPPLKEYFIVTTSKDDTKLTQLAQHLTQDQEAAGRRIHIEVWGWDTLQERIDQYDSAKQAFDPGFSPSIASQDRKLDVIAAVQERAATKDQISDLAIRIGRIGTDTLARLPTRIADREVTENLMRTLRRRGFVGTDVAAELAALAERVIDGDLSLASDAIRSEMCDRAARTKATATTLAVARQFRASAVAIDPSRDLFIADALLKEAEGDTDGALRLLKTRSDAEALAALLTALIRHRGADAALAWARAEGLKPSDLNPPGAMNFVLQQIEHGAFDDALVDIGHTPGEFFDECPGLRLLRAQLTLASILPSDQKAALFQGLPLNPRNLQLAAGARGQERIRAAAGEVSRFFKFIDRTEAA
ncbi:MAG: hypothetical protein Q8P46_11020 [Hyphomicrobiales bacterium]|nr:hypothetical protein [Hyphomicrobiales bacterium]